LQQFSLLREKEHALGLGDAEGVAGGLAEATAHGGVVRGDEGQLGLEGSDEGAHGPIPRVKPTQHGSGIRVRALSMRLLAHGSFGISMRVMRCSTSTALLSLRSELPTRSMARISFMSAPATMSQVMT